MFKNITVFALLATATANAKDSRPNILFVFSDDHAVKAISAHGGPLANVTPTPNIDRIAREGAVFINSFCANSICGPSRANILTGKHSHKNGFMRNRNKFNPVHSPMDSSRILIMRPPSLKWPDLNRQVRFRDDRSFPFYKASQRVGANPFTIATTSSGSMQCRNILVFEPTLTS